jgi:hypothetical protein
LVVLWARLTCQTKALAAMQPPCSRCATYRLAGRLHGCQHFTQRNLMIESAGRFNRSDARYLLTESCLMS